MLKILIIDDEKMARVALHYLLTESKKSYSIMEAVNGQEGYELFCRERPDIVMLDINMPQMNGILFLEKIEKELGNTKIIIISGYDEFQFAQKAIEYNVIGYLLKPINRQELYSVMQRAEEAIAHDSMMANRLQSANRDRKIFFFRELISGKEIYQEPVYKEEMRGIFPECLYAVCVCRWNFEGAENRRIYQFLEDFLSERCQALCFESRSMENILVLYGFQSESDLKRYLYFLRSAFRENITENFMISLGLPVEGIEAIALSYRSARKHMGKIDLLSGDRFADYGQESAPKENKKRNMLEPYKATISKCFLKNQEQELEKVLRALVMQLRQEPYFTILQAELLLQQFMVFADELCLNHAEERNLLISMPEWHVKMNRICSMDDYEQLLLELGREAIIRMQQSNIDLQWALRDIKNFLDMNFSKELNLDVLAQRYSFSKQYLNKSFKKKYQMSIYEYLLDIRMKKAADLLTHTQLDVKQVAEFAGYSDPGYFGKAFKKYFNESPYNYRANRKDT